MKAKLIHLLTIIVAIVLISPQEGRALELLKDMSLKWKAYPRGTVTVTHAPDGTPCLEITLPKTAKKETYAAVQCFFNTRRNLADLKQMEVTVAAQHPIKVSMRLDAKKQNAFTGWSKLNAHKLDRKFEFTCQEIKKTKDMNLENSEAVTIGFGLWQYDTTKNTNKIIVKNPCLVTPQDRFIVPKPTAGVVIDANFQKDWGFENHLYLWTPPDFIRLQGKQNALNRDKAPNPQDFSGKLSLMADQKYIYFLAIVADKTPAQGNNPASPWLNDSVELFLATGLKHKDLKEQPKLKDCGIQIIFDAATNGKPYVARAGKVTPEKSVKARLNKTSVMVQNRPVPGYVIEAAIPWKLLPKHTHRGELLAFCVNLNDAHTGTTLRTNTKCTEPHQNAYAFNKAYIEYQGQEKLPDFKFGPVATNPTWPKEYHAGNLTIWDDELLHSQTRATSNQVYLNSFWAVQGTQDETASPNPKAWFYAPLPMSIGWHTPTYRLDEKTKNQLVPVPYQRITDKGKNTFYWYERTVFIPNDIKGQHVSLTMEFAHREVLVSINGKNAGTISLLRPTIPVTKYLQPGKLNRIDLRLFGNMPYGPSSRLACGIIGDIYLTTAKHQPVITDVWIQKADGITGNFTVNIQAPKLQKGRLSLDLLTPHDQLLFHATRKVNGNQKTTFSGTCVSFKPWSPEKPTLTTARVRAFDENGILIQETTQTFGFRTFTVKNGRFLINGKIVRLRTAPPTNLAHIYTPYRFEHLKKLGFNAIYFHAADTSYNDPFYDLCDQKGFLTLAPVEQSFTDELTREIIRRIRNHPAIIGYLSDPYGQLNSNGFNLNPFQTDDDYMPTSELAKSQQAFMEKREKLFRQADPQRHYVAQATGNWKNTMRILHHYPTNGLNLLDRMMYHQPWAKRKQPKLPLYLIEAGTINLYSVDLKHPEHKFPVLEERKLVDRYLFREAAAKYLGDKAFKNWMEWDVMLFKAALRNFRLNGVDGFCPWEAERFAFPVNTKKPLGVKDNRKLAYPYIMAPVRTNKQWEWMRTNSWYYRLRALATYPWPPEFGQESIIPKETPFATLYKNEMQPLHVAIVGPQNQVFTMDHNFMAGEKIHKQIAIVNDTEHPCDIQGTITLNVDGHESVVKSFSTTAPQGNIVFQPVDFILPQVTRKTNATLTVDAYARMDSFNLTIFPQPKANALKDLEDPLPCGIAQANHGSIARKAGLTGIPVDLTKNIPKTIKALIVERGAIPPETNLDALAEFLNQGGQILVFQQDDQSLFSHRLTEQRLEHVFIADQSHPALEGLDEQDLKFWRGRAETVTNEKRPSDAFRHNQSVALDTPHLTNRNIVAGFALENPAYGAIHPILTGGYDQACAVLLEARSGKGRIIFCQADLASRYGEEPAATILANNLIRYILTPETDMSTKGARSWFRTRKTTPVQPIQGVRYLGDKSGEELLERLGIARVKESPILLVGPGKIDLAQLKQAKVILRLPNADFLPEGVTLTHTYLTQRTQPYFWNGTFYQFELLKGIMPATDFPRQAGPAFRGLTASDAYFFENPKTEVYEFTKRPGDTRSPQGTMAQIVRNNQTVILCAVNPQTLKTGEERRKAYRIWSVIFNNLNVANRHRIDFQTPCWDLTNASWQLVTDPDGKGEEHGFQNLNFGNRKPRPIKTGIIWEDQGVTEANPFLKSAPFAAYDGYAWYVTTLNLKDVPQGDIYFHVNGIRDIATFSRTTQQSTLFINGKKVSQPIGIYNAYLGGRGARLWKMDAAKTLKKGKNVIAIRIYNDSGAGGIHKNPVRFEFFGKNRDQLFPYEFNESKYTNDFFWCW